MLAGLGLGEIEGDDVFRARNVEVMRQVQWRQDEESAMAKVRPESQVLLQLRVPVSAVTFDASRGIMTSKEQRELRMGTKLASYRWRYCNR